MAEATAIQKSELDAERQALRARVSRFRRQIEQDRDALKDEANRLVGSESPAAQHPKTLVAAGAGVGLALGLAPTKVPKPHVPKPPGAGMAANKAKDIGLDALKVEAGMVLQDFVAGIFGKKDDSPSVSPPKQLGETWRHD